MNHPFMLSAGSGRGRGRLELPLPSKPSRRGWVGILWCLLVLLQVPGTGLADLVSVTDRSLLPSNDTVDWASLGPSGSEGISISNPFVTYSSRNLRVNGSLASGNFIRVDQDLYQTLSSGGWDGDFAEGAHLLATLNGPITLQFGAPIRAVGAQVDADFGPFVATIEAFDKGGNSLGYFSHNGNATTAADNSAMFIGVQGDSNNIVFVQFSVVGNDSTYTGELAINQLSLYGSTNNGITIVPSTQAVCAGSTVTFSVQSAGGNPVSYQWQAYGTNLKDGRAVSGSRTPFLTLDNVQSGQYLTVKVTDANGTETTSERATLIVESCTPNFVVSTATSPPNAGSTSGGGSYPAGSTATVTASPSSCYHFLGWTKGAGIVSRSPTYSFKVVSDVSLTAVFSPNTYKITTRTSPAAGGIATGGGTKACGAGVTLVAKPRTGYQFVNWTLNGSVVASTPTYTFSATASATYVANFKKLYAITTQALPSQGGATSGDGTYASGTSVTVNATAALGFSFVEWKAGNKVVSTSPAYTFTVTRNLSLVAVFATASP